MEYVQSDWGHGANPEHRRGEARAEPVQCSLKEAVGGGGGGRRSRVNHEYQRAAAELRELCMNKCCKHR